MSDVARQISPRSPVSAGLIVLTGPSGVGKTTVAETLRRLLTGGWALWLSDRCQPQFMAGSGLDDDRRTFAANVGSIRSYVDHGWPIIAELSVLSDAEAESILDSVHARTKIFQLVCTPATLASHLVSRGDPPEPRSWAERFYRVWCEVTLAAATQLSVDDLTALDVAARIRAIWSEVA